MEENPVPVEIYDTLFKWDILHQLVQFFLTINHIEG